MRPTWDVIQRHKLALRMKGYPLRIRTADGMFWWRIGSTTESFYSLSSAIVTGIRLMERRYEARKQQ